jgi:GMP synthase-like glutamine amidotransferase
VDAVIWQGSGAVWRGAGWGSPLQRRLDDAGWRTRLVPWGDPGHALRGAPDVLHVVTGGAEPLALRSAECVDRLGAVREAMRTAADGACSVVGICLGAQMIAAVHAGLDPERVPTGGEAGVARVRAQVPGLADLTVGTVHVEQVPAALLDAPGVTHLWGNTTTTVQGFRVGARVVGVQFHPELAGDEAVRAGRRFRRVLRAPLALADASAVDPRRTLAAVLGAAGAGVHGLLEDDAVAAAG